MGHTALAFAFGGEKCLGKNNRNSSLKWKEPMASNQSPGSLPAPASHPCTYFLHLSTCLTSCLQCLFGNTDGESSIGLCHVGKHSRLPFEAESSQTENCVKLDKLRKGKLPSLHYFRALNQAPELCITSGGQKHCNHPKGGPEQPTAFPGSCPIISLSLASASAIRAFSSLDIRAVHTAASCLIKKEAGLHLHLLVYWGLFGDNPGQDTHCGSQRIT